jgi:hypothetical protein
MKEVYHMNKGIEIALRVFTSITAIIAGLYVYFTVGTMLFIIDIFYYIKYKDSTAIKSNTINTIKSAAIYVKNWIKYCFTGKCNESDLEKKTV